ncbi:MAG: glycoside hydrolase family 3 C-terminal domain-containing protein [Clostridiales bacterium]|nr:glycoside hydrolase family 3 C-terminal domain-containing protein [Clostridiales bacterium]
MTREERLKYTASARKLIESMTLEEKISLMSGDSSIQQVSDAKLEGYHFNYAPFEAGGCEKYQIPALCYCDGPRGVVCGYGETTCFPVPILRGASFDVELEEEIGRAIGEEVRAAGGNLYGGICVNLPWHPGWGRSQEVYGEDSFALGAMGVAAVRGVQAAGVMACVKHYAFNSMENSRFQVNVTCRKRTEREVFLAHFKECVDAGAAVVMSAYNQYQGEHCGHSEYLIRQVLKEEWGFDGIVISDFFWGILDTVKAAKAGVDVEMCHTRYYGEKLADAVQKGEVPETVVDEAALRIVRTILAFEEENSLIQHEEVGRAVQCKKEVNTGNFEGTDRFGHLRTWRMQDYDRASHRELALKSAQEGITLIKNEHQILPLKKDLRKIAVIGRLASAENTGDHGSSRVYPAHVVTPLEGLVKAVPDTEVAFYDGDDMEHIKQLAKESDAAVFVVGLDFRDEGEYNSPKTASIYGTTRGGDRSSLSLRPADVQVLKETGAVNPVSVAILMGGGAITVSEWEQNIPAILHAYYPGQEGGTALAQILFGEVNPSGKLPFVLPYSENDFPEMNWEADTQYYGYYHGYMYLDQKRVKPYRSYGFGLSYTSFQLDRAVFTCDGKRITASVDIENSGAVSGAEVIQLYVGCPHSDVERPARTLCGFQRVTLAAGQKQRVSLSCPVEKLSYYNEETQKFELEYTDYEVYIGTSEAEEDLQKGTIRLCRD